MCFKGYIILFISFFILLVCANLVLIILLSCIIYFLVRYKYIFVYIITIFIISVAIIFHYMLSAPVHSKAFGLEIIETKNLADSFFNCDTRSIQSDEAFLNLFRIVA